MDIWVAIATITGILSFVIGLSAVHIKTFVESRLVKLEIDLTHNIRKEFVTIELVNSRMQDFDRRITRLEEAKDGD